MTHYIKSKRVVVDQVPSKDNWSTVLTKPVGMADFKFDIERASEFLPNFANLL